jgi:hypothetical protein
MYTAINPESANEKLAPGARAIPLLPACAVYAGIVVAGSRAGSCGGNGGVGKVEGYGVGGGGEVGGG